MMGREATQTYEFGPFTLDPAEKSLRRDGQPVSITPKSFDLLVVLAENRGRLMTKEALLEQVWPDSFVEEANLSVKMSELRRTLGESPNDNEYIETVPRRGYRFVADVVERSANENGASDSSQQARGAAPPRTVSDPVQNMPYAGPRWALIAVAAIFVIAVAGAYYYWFARPGNTGTRQISSIAVLPMANLSGDPAEDYFADGMTDTLISGLARVGALRVISRTSVMQFKGVQKQLPEIGRELNVDAIIEGSVQRVGDRVKITVQLIDAQTDQHLWSQTYDREIKDIFVLQNEISRAVTDAIQVKLTAQEQTRLTAAQTIDPAAYDFLLRGKFYLDRQTKADNATAIQLLDQSVGSDPNFAAAHATLAQACVWRIFLFTPNEKQWEEKAFISVEKALSLDPDLAEAHLARGRLLWTPSNRFPHDQAIQEYKRALELNPNLDEARNQLALVYGHVGLLDQSLEELKKAVAINPSNTVARYRIGETLLFQGKYNEALAVFRSVPREANPALIGYQTAWALLHLDRNEEAAATLDEFLGDYPDDSGGVYTSVQAVLAASAGDRGDAERKINSAIEKGKGFGHFHHTAFHIACAYALLNQPDKALEWLKRVADSGFPCYPLFANEKMLQSIRQDPRFTALIDDMKKRSEAYRSI
jgi:TolB-like protein/DNA-binding winged helix-turn-helix (wHTH) protein/tetratricopeptide (TPR) repeat protein